MHKSSRLRDYLRTSFAPTLLHIVLVISVFSYLALDLNRPINLYDEGTIVYGAARVLQGAIPYRDFWSVYSPGQFYVVAWLFQLFGPSIYIARIWDILVRFLIVVAVYLITRRLTATPPAILSAVIAAVIIVPLDFYYGYTAFPSLLFMLLSIAALVNYISSRQSRWIVGCGVCIGVTTLFRADFGAYIFLAITLPGIIIGAAQAFRRRPFPILPVVPAQRRNLFRPIFLFAGGLAAVILPVLAYLLFNVSWGDLWFDLVAFPLQIPAYRHLPYPPLVPSEDTVLLFWLRFYIPILVAVISSVLLLIRYRYLKDTDQILAYVWGRMALILSAMLLFLQTISRNSDVHITPSYVVTSILLALLLFDIHSSDQSLLVRAGGTGGVSIICACLLIIPLSAWFYVQKEITQLDCVSKLERSGCIYVPSDTRQAITYITAHTRPDEAVYVGLTRHDKGVSNDIMFYFLANRRSATPYYELHPGITTSLPVQQEIIASLNTYKVQYVVLWSGSEAMIEPNASSISSGINLLDDFIHAHYEPVAQFGLYKILHHK
jgi:hypothetical protein